MTETKTCNKCKEDKPLSAFSKNKQMPDGLQYSCKECANLAARQNYQDNKERYFLQAKKRDKEMRDWLNEHKSVPCADCGGVFDPVCMDFDHLPGHAKVMDVSQMRRRRMAWDTIKEEVAKCEVVCANCHRLRTKHRVEEISDGDCVQAVSSSQGTRTQDGL